MMASGSRTGAWLEALPTMTVTQPAHLETHDATLATEILPAPPTLTPLNGAGAGVGTKRDSKRAHGGPSVISYLPAHDPSSTFSSMYAQTFSEPPPPPPPLVSTAGSVLGATAEPEQARRPKRARLLPGGHHRLGIAVKTAHQPLTITIRRGSPARIPPAIDSDITDAVSGDELDGGLSRERSLSSPSPADDEPDAKPPTNPVPVQPLSVRDDVVLHNNDHCSSCRSVGALVYCDGCPRAFHLWCLDPPIEPADLSSNVKWLCPACSPSPQSNAPPPKRRSKLDSHPIFGALLSTMREQLPTEFQLPQEIRSYFRDVATGPRGTYLGGGKAPRPSYVLRSLPFRTCMHRFGLRSPSLLLHASACPPRLHRRNGVLEDREPFKLRDRDNEPVLCFRCNKTAYSGPTASRPNSSSSSYSSMRTIDAHGAPFGKRQRLSNEPNSCDVEDDDASIRSWRSIVSCDYCDLHWHLDCLDPPLTVMPPRGHRWMCPNHVDQALPNRRVPKHVHKVVDINDTGVLNNGFIDIIPSDDLSRGPSVDEVFIAGTRYRVPERIVLLDFWDRCQCVHLPVRVPRI
ncbi:hypothetical protein BKA62DRAFT_42014 [Auriculariales sp. MPI-PUGE-AT-0066]|nr:hypothetical protein BKA62DRAFT_42014 [Auriculariales sp. MPI-PUGE-AT-0066]